MKTIWKYSVPIYGVFELSMPEGAKILSTQMQRDEGVLWAIVDTEAKMNLRKFLIWTTGNPITHDLKDVVFIGTFQMDNGLFVAHLFELIEKG